MKNYPEVHCHPQSLDTASTPEEFLKRELELETGALTVTDHGTLAGCPKIYQLAKGAGITPILGLESYVRDDYDDLLLADGMKQDDKGTFKNYLKYTHLTMHFLDQEAYHTGIRLLSKAPLEKHGSESKPIFNWNDIEELGSKNVTFGSSCLIGLISRHLITHNRPDLSLKYFDKLKSIVKPNNLVMEVFPHTCDKYWVDGIFISLQQGDKIEKLKFRDEKKLRTNKGEVTAGELAQQFNKKNQDGHETLDAVKNYQVWTEREPLKILKVEKVADFLHNECTPMSPDGDLQKSANSFIIELANKYDLPIVCSGDSHFAYDFEKVAQDVRLGASGGSWKMSVPYNRQSSQDSYEHFNERLGINLKTFEGWVQNNIDWASRFKDFKLGYKPSLPTKFYPQDTVKYTLELIKKHGRMPWGDKRYEDRLKYEIKLFHKNGTLDWLPYFHMAEEICSEYEKAGKLNGPSRGSAGGVLTAYLLGVTHVDPIECGLSINRFMTPDRIASGKPPDIDLDFPNRDLLVGYEEEVFDLVLDNGYTKTVPVGSKVLTELGMVDVEEAVNRGLDVIGFE